MDNAALAKLRSKYPDALTGASCRSSTFINLNLEGLAQREWLEATRITGYGWAVRRMVWKPTIAEGGDAKIAQTYLADSNKPGHGLGFIDALLKLHEYEAAQPLLGYLVDPDDTGAVMDAPHYVMFSTAEGIAFKGDDIVLPVDGIIAENGEFSISTMKAVFDAAKRNAVANLAPDYNVLFPLPGFDAGPVCKTNLSIALTNLAKDVREHLKRHGSDNALDDCSAFCNPFYKPQCVVFEKSLQDSVNAMQHVKRRSFPGQYQDETLNMINSVAKVSQVIHQLEFHALRLSLAWTKNAAQNNPDGDHARVQSYIERATKRCVDIMRQLQIPDSQFDHLLDLDIDRATKVEKIVYLPSVEVVTSKTCNLTEINKIINWFAGLDGNQPKPAHLGDPGVEMVLL